VVVSCKQIVSHDQNAVCLGIKWKKIATVYLGDAARKLRGSRKINDKVCLKCFRNMFRTSLKSFLVRNGLGLSDGDFTLV
jgi:hypothetical protein